MKQICKRLSAIFLALTLISGTVLTTGIVAQADIYGKVLFSDDFNSYGNNSSGAANLNAMNANGWDIGSNGKGNYNTGSSYRIPGGVEISAGTSKFSGSSDWENYSVEAKMTYVPDDASSGATCAGISGRVTSTSHNKGYDLIVMKDKPEDTGATLRLRYNGDKLKDVNIETLSNNTQFTLKLEFRDTVIYGYFNNEPLISYDTANDAEKNAKGWVGIRKDEKTGMNVVYDDYTVTEIELGAYPTGYLYYSNFEETVLAEAENSAEAFEMIGFTTTSNNKIENGEVLLGAGQRAYLTKVIGSSDWDDYTVEAQVQIVKGDDDTATKGYAGIIARSSNENSDGYEFSMAYSGSTKKLTLTKRNGETSALGSMSYAFEFNKYYKLIMTVQGDNIMCWIDDTLVFDVEDKDATTYAKGYAGFRSTGNATADYLNGKVDNFSVKEYQKPTVSYPDGYFYCNDFESEARLTTEGWLNDGTKANGVYTLDGSSNNYLTGVDGSDKWTDYVVEADVTLIDNGTEPQYAGIVGRSTEPRGNGYEFILVKDDGITTARLYKRGVYSGMINREKYQTEVTLEQENHLKMVLDGKDIYCYLNDELLFEVADNDTEKVEGERKGKKVNLSLPQFLEGYAGVISASGTAKSSYDNFEVREIEESDYPTIVYPEGYLYYNDFSSIRSIDREGWYSNGTKKDGYYILDGADEKDKISSNNYLTKVAGSTEWTDYVVEADVILHDNGEYPQYTAIVARSTNRTNNGYEMQLITKAEGSSLELRHRGKGDANVKLDTKNISVIPNEKHSMKMVVKGATITCYFDGVKMFEVTDDNPYWKGYAGVRCSDGTAKSSFDYFAVREITADDIVTDPIIKKQDGDIWFYDNFTGEESMSERGWSSDQVNLYNGSALVKTRVVVDGVQDCDKWTDYEVSAIVNLDKEAGMLSETATTGVAAVVARSLSSKTGYEFGILASQTEASYLRLYDRTKGITIAEDDTTPIKSGEHEMRMVCIGNEIYCYFDGKLVFAVQSDSAANGYAGMRAANYNSYYKEFTVRKARPVASILPSSPATTSPQTGDFGFSPVVMYLAAATLSLSVIGFVVTFSYGKKKQHN